MELHSLATIHANDCLIQDKLYAMEAMAVPANMTLEPRIFQLIAARQARYCLEGDLHLFLLGDEMGVGKTLTAILVMFDLKDGPGMSIVLAPKNLCQQWVDTIHEAWEEVIIDTPDSLRIGQSLTISIFRAMG